MARNDYLGEALSITIGILLGLIGHTVYSKISKPIKHDVQPKTQYTAPLLTDNKAEKNYKAEKGYKTSDLNHDSDEILLARMIFGEARNCETLEKIAVAYTALNRTEDGKSWNGDTLREVLLCPLQYSCFNEGDINRKKLMNPLLYEKQAFRKCLEVAKGVLSGKYPDPANGATNYFNPDYADPSWQYGLTRIGRIKIGDTQSKHVFFK